MRDHASGLVVQAAVHGGEGEGEVAVRALRRKEPLRRGKVLHH